MNTQNKRQTGRPLTLSHKGRPILLLSLLLILIFAVMIWNAAKLREALSHSTQGYLRDVTSESASDIRDSFQSRITNLKMMADSLSQIREYQGSNALAEFLERKAHILEFDRLILINREGSVIASAGALDPGADSGGSPNAAPSIQIPQEACVTYTGGKYLLYSTPVYRDNGPDELLMGTRSTENIQDMISANSFNGQMLSCIVDNNGRVVISPTDLKPFLRLDDLFRNDQNQEVIADIHRMQADVKGGREGLLKFTSATGEKLYLSYNALHLNDWFLLTIIPADIITSGAERYIWQTFAIVGVTILFFTLFLLSLFRLYGAHKKYLEQIAFTDPLTGGLNNAAFQARYRSLADSLKPGTFAIVFLNVCGFKLINEQYTTEGGNRLLCHLYRTLERTADRDREEFAARGESDHFFLCLREHDPQTIQLRLDQVIREINASQAADLPALPITVRSGVCLVEDPGQDITILQDHARLASQNPTPDHSRICAFYDDSLTDRLRLEQELNTLFDSSLERGDFLIYLQPKISLPDNRLAGAEALVRWNHPVRGIIPPSDFIPLFERNGKICALDRYVFTGICAALAGLKQDGREMFPVSVNLSRQHFRTPGFLDDFAHIAGQHGIPRGIIEFELTESIFFDNRQIEIVKESIRTMHDLGFLCSLDDFGAGFSSLGLLKEFDVDTIKLDRSFFLNMSGRKAKDIIASLVELAGHLQVRTVAEGIETPDQVEYLRSIHCDMVQGYVFSKPLPIPEFMARYLS